MQALVKAEIKLQAEHRQHRRRQQYLPLQDIEMEDPENGKNGKQKETETVREFLERTEKTINTHIIVAALITTVALTAGFAVPGGFDAEKGPTQGSPVLLTKAAFRTFIVTDAIALVFSISSLFLYFWTILIKDKAIYYATMLFWGSTLLNLLSIAAMMLAFISGTYAVLAHSSVLAITVCTISSVFLLSIFYYVLAMLCTWEYE